MKIRHGTKPVLWISSLYITADDKCAVMLSGKTFFCKIAPKHFELTFKFGNKVGEISKQDLDVGKSNNYGIFSIEISAREKLRQNYDGPRMGQSVG